MRAALALALGCVVTRASAQQAVYEGGVSLATGQYIFTERTTSWALVSTLAMELGRVTLRATLPVFAQNTSLVTGSPAGGLPTGGSSHGAVGDSGRARQGSGGGPSASLATSRMEMGGSRHGPPVETPPSAVTGYQLGFGDPMGLATARLVQTGRTSASAAVTLKVPLTDTTAFGTGEWDAGASASVSQIVGSVTLSADVSYWWFGDMPALELRDGPWATVSVSKHFGDWLVAAAGSGGVATLAGFEPPISVSASVGRLGGSTLWALMASVGVTETVADFSLAATWRVPL